MKLHVESASFSTDNGQTSRFPFLTFFLMVKTSSQTISIKLLQILLKLCKHRENRIGEKSSCERFCCNMALVSFRLFCKNLGHLRECFGQMVYRPPWQKISRTPMYVDACHAGYESVWLCDFRMVLTGIWSRGWTAVWPKYSVPAINIVSSVFSLADCTLEKRLSTQENWI